MPSQKIHIREYTLRSHYRTIDTQVFRLICSDCRQHPAREEAGLG